MEEARRAHPVIAGAGSAILPMGYWGAAGKYGMNAKELFHALPLMLGAGAGIGNLGQLLWPATEYKRPQAAYPGSGY
jgi:hypothetical protein